MLCIPDTLYRDLRISDVPVTTGVDRDEAVINPPVPTTSNVTEYLQQLTSLFKVDWRSLLGGVAPELPNTTESNLALATTFGTAATLKCLDQALAYSAAKYRAFSSIYRFEFNHTYSP
jgi:hypothetical protein